MDTILRGFSGSMNGFKFDNCSGRNVVNGFNLTDPDFRDLHILSNGPYVTSEGDSPEEGGFSDAILKYISQILMDEDLEDKSCMFEDCLALQAAEKSLYDVLGEKYPGPSPNQNPPCVNRNVESPDDCELITRKCNNYCDDVSEFQSSDRVSNYQSNSQSFCSTSGFFCDASGGLQVEPPPVSGNNCVNYGVDKAERNYLANGSSSGRKNHHLREDGDYIEGRSNKQPAVFADDAVEQSQSEMFDKVLLMSSGSEVNDDSTSGKLQQNGQSNGRTGRGKKWGINKREMVDLRGLLTQCAQAVAGSDSRTANELLKQIRQHSSPVGDGSQRLAHCFANGLEARLAGTGKQLHAAFHTKRTSAADILKAYQVYVTACPFKKVSNSFANRTIAKLAQKATTLHIIDFGIHFGFQWPCLIHRLSKRPGGPPKLRITGIDFPQPGFRPAERVDETGRRLARYCERFNVPFEYNAIAQRWETIRFEDLKIDRDEVLVVNCLYRLKNVLDDTVVVNSPRDAVLNLIKRINPDIFIHGVVNGTYSAPFFVTRFREALFHFSALFDMFEANVPREDQERMLFERELFGRDVMNVIACEGCERVERPETYKQWQVRNQRAGFRQLPLNQEIVKQDRTKVKLGYHKDFVVDEDGNWMLQGWKGRIIYALSCWKPVQEL